MVHTAALAAKTSTTRMNHFGIGFTLWLGACPCFQPLTPGSFLRCHPRALHPSFTASLLHNWLHWSRICFWHYLFTSGIWYRVALEWAVLIMDITMDKTANVSWPISSLFLTRMAVPGAHDRGHSMVRLWWVRICIWAGRPVSEPTMLCCLSSEAVAGREHVCDKNCSNHLKKH